MALPVGVTTATITFGVPVSFTGGAVRSTVSIVPSASLVHTATGTPLVNFIEDVITSEGVSGQFTLPHTDQLGFQDESGNSYQNWYYTATISYSAGKTTLPPRTKTFQLPTGQTTVDLDLLPAGAPVLPWTAATANVTSFHGRIGAVTVQDSDLPSRLSDASLDASYASKAEVRLTVAASDSTARAKARADYVCTGVGDLAVIQAACDALPDNAAVSGEVVILAGNYYDSTDATVSIGSPTSATTNPRKVLRFERGGRLNVSGRTGRKAVLKVEAPDCQIINPNIAGNASFGTGTGIAMGGDVATFGGRWDKVYNRAVIWNPIISNLETGIEFSSIDGGPGVGGSVGDCMVRGGYIFQNKTGVRAAGYTNTIDGIVFFNNNVPIWVESRRSEAQLRSYATCIVGWNEVGIKVDGGFGSVFHDTWMEQNSVTAGSPALEAIRLGLSASVRANFTRFTGNTHIQLASEQLYAVHYIGATGTVIDDLVISTSGTVPSVSVVRNDMTSVSKRNRIDRTTFGPSSIPTHTALTLDAAAQGELFMERVPGTTGSVPFSTRLNPSTRATNAPVVRKSADASKTSDATMATDSDMTMWLSLQTNYALTGLIIFDASQTGDFKMQFTVPANATIQWVGVGPATSHTSALGVSSVTTNQATSGFVQAWGGAGAGIPIAVPITGIVKVTDTFGSLSMSWAQNTSDTTPTIFKNGSWLKLEPIP